MRRWEQFVRALCFSLFAVLLLGQQPAIAETKVTGAQVVWCGVYTVASSTRVALFGHEVERCLLDDSRSGRACHESAGLSGFC